VKINLSSPPINRLISRFISSVFVQEEAACQAAKTCDGSLQRPYPSLQPAANYFYYNSNVVNNIVLFPGHYNTSEILADNVVLNI